MNNGISGYGPGRIPGYTQVEPRSDTPSRSTPGPEAADSASAPRTMHPELSEEESGMIRKYFPDSELSLRLYGPGRDSRSIHPNGVGRRIDIRG